jgi:hypothetical protein
MQNYEMERRDWSFDMISGREMVNSNDEETLVIKKFWRGRDIEFNSWMIAHLLGDDRRLPYGTKY